MAKKGKIRMRCVCVCVVIAFLREVGLGDAGGPRNHLSPNDIGFTAIEFSGIRPSADQGVSTRRAAPALHGVTHGRHKTRLGDAPVVLVDERATVAARFLSDECSSNVHPAPSRIQREQGADGPPPHLRVEVMPVITVHVAE